MFFTKKIPYYGKYNSISKISLSDDSKTFLVKRYDNNGFEKNEIFEINNKTKNIEMLLINYYNDVEEYLKKNKNKYLSYKEQKITIKKMFDINIIEKLKKITKSSMTISLLLIVLSFFVMNNIITYYIGLLILIPSSTGLILLNDIAKEINIKTFIDEYEEFEFHLTEYQKGLEHQNKKSITEYNGLNKDKNKGNDLNLKKIRTLENKIA